MEVEQVKRIHEKIEAVDKRVDGITDDLKGHCKDTDKRIRDLENKASQQEIQTQQFMDLQTKQNNTLERLMDSLTKLDKTMMLIKVSTEDLHAKYIENKENIECVKNNADNQIQKLSDKLNKHEEGHLVDIRQLQKNDAISNLQKVKPYAITIGILGAVGAVIYAFNQLFALINAIPK